MKKRLAFFGRLKPFLDALNNAIGGFDQRQMASISEQNHKPFILNILNLSVDLVDFLVDTRLVK